MEVPVALTSDLDDKSSEDLSSEREPNEMNAPNDDGEASEEEEVADIEKREPSSKTFKVGRGHDYEFVEEEEDSLDKMVTDIPDHEESDQNAEGTCLFSVTILVNRLMNIVQLAIVTNASARGGPGLALSNARTSYFFETREGESH